VRSVKGELFLWGSWRAEDEKNFQRSSKAAMNNIGGSNSFEINFMVKATHDLGFEKVCN